MPAKTASAPPIECPVKTRPLCITLPPLLVLFSDLAMHEATRSRAAMNPADDGGDVDGGDADDTTSEVRGSRTPCVRQENALAKPP